MVRSVRNPTRRSRKIGTSAQGFKRRNNFAIPSPYHGGLRFYERLVSPIELPQNLNGHSFTILVEPTFDNFKYYTSISDVITVLKMIPADDRSDIKTVVFRQPKRKERIFQGVWGRMAYWANFGPNSGTSIIIEALPVPYSYRLDNHVGPVFAQELTCLEEDGHGITQTQRAIEIGCPPSAIRNTQLFRTLAHEIGHHVDFQEKVQRPSDRDEGDWSELYDLYFARPKREREQFADRYARDVMSNLKQKGLVPFPPQWNGAELGLKPEWFYFVEPSE